MDYVFLSLILFGGWWAAMWVLYIVIAKKVLRENKLLTLEQRLEFLKTRRQRNLK